MLPDEIAEGRRFVFDQGGVHPLLIMAHIYQRRLGADIAFGAPDPEEAERWIEFAIDHGAGTRRYLGSNMYSETN